MHPEHIVPLVEFIARLTKTSDWGVAKMSVEIATLVGYVFVVAIVFYDAGVEVDDILLSEGRLQLIVELTTDALAVYPAADVDGSLDGPYVGWSAVEDVAICVAIDASLAVDVDEIGVVFERFGDAVLELL